MQYILFALLIVIAAAFAIIVQKKDRKIQELLQERDRLRQRAEQSEQETKKLEALQAEILRESREKEAAQAELCRQAKREFSAETESVQNKIWDWANTIHLYASLAEEETGSEAVKEKQREIKKSVEEILDFSRFSGKI